VSGRGRGGGQISGRARFEGALLLSVLCGSCDRDNQRQSSGVARVLAMN